MGFLVAAVVWFLALFWRIPSLRWSIQTSALWILQLGLCKPTQTFYALPLPSSSFIFSSCFRILASEASQTWQELLGSSQLLLQIQVVLSRHSPAAGCGWIAGCRPKPNGVMPLRAQHRAAAAAGGSLSTVTTHTGGWGQEATPHQARSDACMAVLTPPCAKVNTSHLSKHTAPVPFPPKL